MVDITKTYYSNRTRAPQVPAKMSFRALTNPELAAGGPETTIGDASMEKDLLLSPMIAMERAKCADCPKKLSAADVKLAINVLSSEIRGPPDLRQPIVGLPSTVLRLATRFVTQRRTRPLGPCDSYDAISRYGSTLY
jgi:hypothetical protein